MGSTLVTIANRAADELSIGRDIDSLFGAYNEGDTSDRRLRRALTKTLDYLNTEFTWQFQRREWLFQWDSATEEMDNTPTDVASPVKYWKPADFLRFAPVEVGGDGGGGIYSRSGRGRLVGPLTVTDWQDSRIWGAAYATGGFRIANNILYITPYIGQGHNLAYEYITNHVAVSADGSTKESVSADTDTFPWDDETIALGIIAHYRQIERLDYADDMVAFSRRAQNALRMDGHSQVFDMSGSRRSMIDALRSPAAVNAGTGAAYKSWSVP